jgi:hypothetical protein
MDASGHFASEGQPARSSQSGSETASPVLVVDIACLTLDCVGRCARLPMYANVAALSERVFWA